MAKESNNSKQVTGKSLQINRKFHLTCSRPNIQPVLGYLEKNIIQIINTFQTVCYIKYLHLGRGEIQSESML